MSTLNYILKKYKIDFDEGTAMPIEIPNVGRLDILRWLRELDFKVGVEVGVAEGEYSKLICQTNPQMKMYGVDPWAPYKGYSDYAKRSTFETLFEEAQRRLKPFIKRGRYQIIRKFSMDGLNDFDNDTLD